MKQTQKKLQSNMGSTLIMTLLFMLICVFVGGSVLVSATVNSGRLAHKRVDQQAILSQRSISSVLVDTLMDGGSLKANVSADGDRKTLYVTGSPNEVQLLIVSCIQDAINSAGHEKSFTVKDSRGETVSCTLTWNSTNYVYIEFDNNPTVRLKLVPSLSNSSTIIWSTARIEKAGAV